MLYGVREKKIIINCTRLVCARRWHALLSSAWSTSQNPCMRWSPSLVACGAWLDGRLWSDLHTVCSVSWVPHRSSWWLCVMSIKSHIRLHLVVVGGEETCRADRAL
jgi:hypothetical protein